MVLLSRVVGALAVATNVLRASALQHEGVLAPTKYVGVKEEAPTAAEYEKLLIENKRLRDENDKLRGPMKQAANLEGAADAAAVASDVAQNADAAQVDMDTLKKPTQQLAETRAQSCLAPGKVLFLHVMKTAGVSVEAFLDCICKNNRCGIVRSLGPETSSTGNPDCLNQHHVCSTHGRFADREALCGASFQQPEKVFTLMRDPVERAFSLYNYYVEKGYKLPPLLKILQRCKGSDMRNGTALTESAMRMCQQMSNQMVLYTLAQKDQLDWYYPPTVSDTKHAKDVVKSLSVFFVDEIAQLPQSFANAGVFDETHTSMCPVPHANPTVCPKCRTSPTDEELTLLEELNAEDINLYTWARAQRHIRGLASSRSMVQVNHLQSWLSSPRWA